MGHLQVYEVFPAIPEPLMFLETLSRNLWWSWNFEAIDLFRRIDPRSWMQAKGNPIVFLAMIPPERYDAMSKDESFLSHLEHVRRTFQKEILDPVEPGTYSFCPDEFIAYFSMEFGLDANLPIFAGGLGVLAGDHLKASSDIAFPLVGVGLLYREGYFQQFLDQDAWQKEEYPETDFYHLPISRARDCSGKTLVITVSGPGGNIHAAVWKLNVGRIPLYLLDTNIGENSREHRDLTSRLYPGESQQRLAQEILLGIGGMRALCRMGLEPAVCHMNEGHSSFSSLERLAQTMQRYGVNLKTAKEIVTRTTVFTTHTPVSAGYDEFYPDMVKPYLRDLESSLGIPADQIISFGQLKNNGVGAQFSMFNLGLEMSQYCNGVSQLHGSVARKMWRHIWPGRGPDEIPISHVTNGIHVPTWISEENHQLFERYLGPEWIKHLLKDDFASKIDEIYDEELWHAHELNRTRLIRVCRDRMARHYEQINAPRRIIEDAERVLDKNVLTIGFARRFATYKRANLILQDPERLEALLTDKDRPIQIIYAGKAHPRDNEGKELLRQLLRFIQDPKIRRKIIFLEGYDMNMAKLLVQGVDVWLNTPRRPFEACGTSGMKAALNGVLNVSVLDGWWCEGYSRETGWRIGNGEEYNDVMFQDALESRALYNILENEVIPCFYDRKNGDIPAEWIRKMKASMKMVLKGFSSRKMLTTYYERYYAPAVRRRRELTADCAAEARILADRTEKFRALWKYIFVDAAVKGDEGPFRVGDHFPVTTEVYLGDIRPEEVDVELYFGRYKTIYAVELGETEIMKMIEYMGHGRYRYEGRVYCRVSGRYGFNVRVVPRGDDRIKYSREFITWAEKSF